MKLTRWMADYYLCGWGQVLHAVVPGRACATTPARGSPRSSSRWRRTNCPNPLPTVTPQQKAALDKLKQEGRPLEILQLARLAKCRPGVVARPGQEGARAEVQRADRDDAADATSRDVGGTMTPSTGRPTSTLNADQERVWTRIHSVTRQPAAYKPFLLHGVTGSGKTEIYLRAIEEVVQQGKEAIVLVPEISLTPQTIARFRGRCGNVAVLHSHLTDAERGGYWRRVASGQVQVVVGARSAVFAPTRKLGLIVIDEEHENTFKQESTPRYHARDVAVMRARLENIPILLGSATPCLESWHNADARQVHAAEPAEPRRGPAAAAGAARRPAARAEDAGQALRHRPDARSARCEQALQGEGAGDPAAQPPRVHHARALPGVRPRRAVPQLRPGADVPPQRRRRCVCHYCGFETAPFHEVPRRARSRRCATRGSAPRSCRRRSRRSSPATSCQRMDSDTMTKPGSHERVLDAFRDGLIHILLGTQMIAKGLDFPNVTLVGVVNADVGLHLPDFRAAERTFQLLAQVAGRAGRGDKGGRVLVQTLHAGAPVHRPGGEARLRRRSRARNWLTASSTATRRTSGWRG